LIDGLFRSTDESRKARENSDAPINDALSDAVWNGTRLTQNRLFVARKIKAAGIDADWQKISNISLWNPGELKVKYNDKE